MPLALCWHNLQPGSETRHFTPWVNVAQWTMHQLNFNTLTYHQHLVLTMFITFLVSHFSIIRIICFHNVPSSGRCLEKRVIPFSDKCRNCSWSQNIWNDKNRQARLFSLAYFSPSLFRSLTFLCRFAECCRWDNHGYVTRRQIHQLYRVKSPAISYISNTHSW